MSAAVPTSEADSASEGRAGDRSFFRGLLAIACGLLLLGGLGFGYLRANSPLSLLAGSHRPIAAATVFVPSRSPFTVSLLTKPERLLALQQAVVSPSWREQARSEIAQVQQNFLQATGLDYERDLQPWVGEEITYAYTDTDLDQESANGEQPGYFLALEIAPDRQQQAQSFLQLFWQQQSLAGNMPQSQQISGVRVLSSMTTAAGASTRSPVNASKLGTATALVGNQFVMFANDVRVIRRSIRAAQTAQNLAQNLAYRRAVDALPAQRIGLAYLDTTLLSNGIGNGVSDRVAGKKEVSQNASSRSALSSTFTAVGIGITQTGLMADLRVADAAAYRGKTAVGGKTAVKSETADRPPNAAVPGPLSSATLQYLPATSELAVVGESLAELESALLASGLSTDVLPEFLRLGYSLPENPWQQMTSDYALAQISSGRSHDWILAVRREENTDAIVQVLNQAATKAGYSVVPVPLENDKPGAILDDGLDSREADREDVRQAGHQAMAWTRFKVGKRRQAGSGLETELLALHLQQGDCEIYASSLAAMNSALAAPSTSLLKSPRFLQAIAPIDTPNDGYLYVDWPAVAPTIDQMLPLVGTLDRAVRPLSNHIRAIAATRQGDRASFFIQLKEMSA